MTTGATARAAHVLATWFGCGHVPVAPGTAGSVGAIPLYLALRALGGTAAVAIGAVVITAVGVWAGTQVARARRQHDPQIVVIDEVAGMLVTLLAAPADARWPWVLAGFALFRVLDSTKPWPCRALERLPEGWGIVMDDVGAGVWGAIAIAAARVALHA